MYLKNNSFVIIIFNWRYYCCHDFRTIGWHFQIQEAWKSLYRQSYLFDLNTCVKIELQ